MNQQINKQKDRQTERERDIYIYNIKTVVYMMCVCVFVCVFGWTDLSVAGLTPDCFTYQLLDDVADLLLWIVKTHHDESSVHRNFATRPSWINIHRRWRSTLAQLRREVLQVSACTRAKSLSLAPESVCFLHWPEWRLHIPMSTRNIYLPVVPARAGSCLVFHL